MKADRVLGTLIDEIRFTRELETVFEQLQRIHKDASIFKSRHQFWRGSMRALTTGGMCADTRAG